METEKEPCTRVGRFIQCLKHLGYDVSWADSAQVVAQGQHEFQLPVEFRACETHLLVRGRKVVGDYSPTHHANLLTVANRLNRDCKLLRVSLSQFVDEAKCLVLQADANLPTEVTDREFHQIFSLWSQELAWLTREFLNVSRTETAGCGL